LKEQSHPRRESITEALFNHFIINTVSPGYNSNELVENVKDLLATMDSDFFVCKRGEETWEKDRNRVVNLAAVLSTFRLLNNFQECSGDSKSEVYTLK